MRYAPNHSPSHSPASVVEALAEGTIHDRCDIDAEVGARLNRAPIDTGFDFAVEEPLAVMLLPPVLGDRRN
jgi:hypothetical protein